MMKVIITVFSLKNYYYIDFHGIFTKSDHQGSSHISRAEGYIAIDDKNQRSQDHLAQHISLKQTNKSKLEKKLYF